MDPGLGWYRCNCALGVSCTVSSCSNYFNNARNRCRPHEDVKVSNLGLTPLFPCRISMFGFTGAWYKNRRNVEYFYELCWFHLWFDVIIGIFYLVSLAWGNSRIKMIEVW